MTTVLISIDDGWQSTDASPDNRTEWHSLQCDGFAAIFDIERSLSRSNHFYFFVL